MWSADVLPRQIGFGGLSRVVCGCFTPPNGFWRVISAHKWSIPAQEGCIKTRISRSGSDTASFDSGKWVGKFRIAYRYRFQAFWRYNKGTLYRRNRDFLLQESEAGKGLGMSRFARKRIREVDFLAKKTGNNANGILLLKKWWFWLIFVVAVGMMAVFGGGTETAETNASDNAAKTAIANFEEMAAAASEEQADADKRAEAAIKAAEEKANAEAQAKAQAEAEAKLKDPANYRTDITYDQLAQTPDDYYSEMIAMSGRVLQVMQGEESSQMLVAVDDSEGAVIFLGYESDITESGIPENALIKFYGTAAGTISYDSTLGETITVPAAFVNMIELQ